MDLAQLFNCEQNYNVAFDNDDLNEITSYLAHNFLGFDYTTIVRTVDTFIKHYELSIDYIAAGVKDLKFHMEWGATHSSRADFLIERVLLMRNNLRIAIHQLFILPEALQGRGLAKIILCSFYRQYQSSGIDQI